MDLPFVITQEQRDKIQTDMVKNVQDLFAKKQKLFDDYLKSKDPTEILKFLLGLE